MSSTHERYTLGIDIGTTKVAVALVDGGTREVIATASLAHESDVTGVATGRSEQKVEQILATLDRCIDRLPHDAYENVESIGVTGQMHGVVLWNEKTREVSHLVTWQDQRCLEGDFLSHLRATTGDPSAQSGYGTATLAWLAHHDSSRLSRYTAAATIHDYVVSRLTGNARPITDPSDAASFGLYDLHTRRWREDALSSAGIPLYLLPEIRNAGERVGALTESFANRWGIRAGVPVGNALGDNQASIFGSLTDPKSQIALTIGTGAQLSVVVPSLPSEISIRCAGYEYRPYVGESFIAVVASLAGGRALAAFGKALEGFIRELGVSPTPSLDRIQTVMHQQGLARFDTDLVASPSLAGERYDTSLRGSINQLSFENFTVGDMIAALCRGLVTSLRDALPKELLASRREVVGSGNAIARSPLIRRVIEESFGCALTLQDSAETTACGAALVAAVKAD